MLFHRLLFIWSATAGPTPTRAPCAVWPFRSVVFAVPLYQLKPHRGHELHQLAALNYQRPSEAVKKWFMEMRCCTRRYRVLSAQAG